MRAGVRLVRFMLVVSLLGVSVPVRPQVCGDGVVDPGETCDPPNLAIDPVTPQPECRLDCTSCGDGVVQTNDVETCDAGPLATACGECLYDCNERLFGTTICPCAFDDPSLGDLRAEILAACQCETSASHGAFLRCARAQLAQVPSDRLVFFCRRTALKCLARSVCGKPAAVTCCRTNAHGVQRCVIKPDAAHCTAPPGGSASLGVSDDCCDACP
jgi:hypothetical protein